MGGVTWMRIVGIGASLLVVLVLSACGDDETSDARGYTKAPLETPAVFVDAEARTDMDRLGVPNRPRGEEIETLPAEPTTTGGN